MSIDVLILDNSIDKQINYHIEIAMLLSRLKLDEVVVVQSALHPEEARFLLHHKECEIRTIAINGDNVINDEHIVKEFRKNGFNGPIIIYSDNEELRKRMLGTGCSDECTKYLVSQKILEVLGILQA